MTVEEFIPRAEKGAEWLDKVVPGWFNRINVQQLDMNSCTSCVLGQACGYYWNVINVIDPKHGLTGPEKSVSPWSIEHGFAIGDHRPLKEYKVLREAWVTVILQRQFAAEQQRETVGVSVLA